MNNVRAYGKILGWIFLNNVIGKSGQRIIGTGGSDSARYCYSVWMRHLVKLNENLKKTYIPSVVAEIGPGDSLGTGFAALISGAQKYYSLDVVNYCDAQKNFNIFNDIVQFYRNKEDIPNDEEFPKINPKLDSYSFPDYLFGDEYLDTLLASERIKKIRDSITSINSQNGYIFYYAPWFNSSIIQEQSVDFLFSQAVLEHVDGLPLVYSSMKRWLKDNALIAHVIDFKSHGTSVKWNGHWSYSDIIWKLIRGRAQFLINRCPLSHHLGYLYQNKFKVVCIERVKRYDGIQREELAEKFCDLTDSDLITSSAYIMCKNIHIKNNDDFTGKS